MEFLSCFMACDKRCPFGWLYKGPLPDPPFCPSPSVPVAHASGAFSAPRHPDAAFEASQLAHFQAQVLRHAPVRRFLRVEAIALRLEAIAISHNLRSKPSSSGIIIAPRKRKCDKTYVLRVRHGQSVCLVKAQVNRVSAAPPTAKSKAKVGPRKRADHPQRRPTKTKVTIWLWSRGVVLFLVVMPFAPSSVLAPSTAKVTEKGQNSERIKALRRTQGMVTPSSDCPRRSERTEKREARLERLELLSGSMKAKMSRCRAGCGTPGVCKATSTVLAPFVAMMPLVPSSFLLLVVMPGATSSCFFSCVY